MTREELNKQELTYDFLKLNFVEDKNTPHLNVYHPQCMFRTDEYYIASQLMSNCYCRKQLEVCKCNSRAITLYSKSRSPIEEMKRPFTVGDLISMLNLVGLNDLADNLMTEEDINGK